MVLRIWQTKLVVLGLLDLLPVLMGGSIDVVEAVLTAADVSL